MKVKSESEVAQSCPTLSDPMDYSLPGSSVHGIFQARALERGAILQFIKCSADNAYSKQFDRCDRSYNYSDRVFCVFLAVFAIKYFLSVLISLSLKL